MDSRGQLSPHGSAGLAMFAGLWQSEGMKKQGSDQAFHDRRYQERKRAEAARKPAKKKVDAEKPGTSEEKQGGEGRERTSE
jgi:hypothetical protein